MEIQHARLGITYEKCVPPQPTPPLMWRSDRPEPGILDLSQEAECKFVETQLETEIEERQNRTHERSRLHREAGKLLPTERVAQCGKGLIDTSRDVLVLRSVDSKRAFYGNVKRCGSLWTCPYCAARITEKKRNELQEALTTWSSRGGRVFMLTLTIPHHSRSNTRELCDQLLGALKKMHNRKFWRSWSKCIGLEGTVRALEVTYGLNGAHAHLHILLFCSAKEDALSPRATDLLAAWKSACLSMGLPEPNEHGVDVRDGSYAAAYVGKWGLDCELTKSHVKRGKGNGRTAWDLLRASADGDQTAGQKFQEHAASFFNRRQLVWSKGLRALLGLGKEKTDAELAQESTENADEIGRITFPDWSRVLRYEARATVLIVAETFGREGLTTFLQQLAEMDSKNFRLPPLEAPLNKSQARATWITSTQF